MPDYGYGGGYGSMPGAYPPPGYGPPGYNAPGYGMEQSPLDAEIQASTSVS